MQSTMQVAAKEADAIARKREFEATRRARMDIPKTFHYGTDAQALAAQLADKSKAKEEEEMHDRAYDEMRLKMDKHLMYVDQQRDKYLRDRDRAVDDYRKEHQRPDQRREFDLNDPEMLKKQEPARAGDDDPKLSASGLQKMAGEDLDVSERVRLQQAQLRDWNAKIQAEKDAKSAAEKHTADVWANHLLEADLKRCEYADKEAQMLRQRRTELADYNLAQAVLKKKMQQEAAAQRELDNVADIQEHLNSAWLTEDPSQTRSFVQPHRPRPDHYKGLTEAERQLILDERARQVEERKAQAAADKEVDDKIAELTLKWDHIAMVKEDEVQKRRAEMRKQLAEENRKQAMEHTAQIDFLNTKEYVNQIDDKFFSRFGSSIR